MARVVRGGEGREGARGACGCIGRSGRRAALRQRGCWHRMPVCRPVWVMGRLAVPRVRRAVGYRPAGGDPWTPGRSVSRSATRATVSSCASGWSGQRSGWARAMSCRTVRSRVARAAATCRWVSVCACATCRRASVWTWTTCVASAWTAWTTPVLRVCTRGGVRFAKGTAGIGAAAGKPGTGLAVLAQDEGRPTVGAVGGEPIGRLGTRGLGQVNGERRHGHDPPAWGILHALLYLLYYQAQTKHSNHEPQTACNTLSRNELWRTDLRGHCERLGGVR